MISGMASLNSMQGSGEYRVQNVSADLRHSKIAAGVAIGQHSWSMPIMCRMDENGVQRVYC